MKNTKWMDIKRSTSYFNENFYSERLERFVNRSVLNRPTFTVLGFIWLTSSFTTNILSRIYFSVLIVFYSSIVDVPEVTDFDV